MQRKHLPLPINASLYWRIQLILTDPAFRTAAVVLGIFAAFWLGAIWGGGRLR